MIQIEFVKKKFLINIKLWFYGTYLYKTEKKNEISDDKTDGMRFNNIQRIENSKPQFNFIITVKLIQFFYIFVNKNSKYAIMLFASHNLMTIC